MTTRLVDIISLLTLQGFSRGRRSIVKDARVCLTAAQVARRLPAEKDPYARKAFGSIGRDFGLSHR